MTAEEKSVLSLFMIGVLIVVGKVLAGGETITPRLFMRIPLYSITDWHRSPISDSHPFDQPGT